MNPAIAQQNTLPFVFKHSQMRKWFHPMKLLSHLHLMEGTTITSDSIQINKYQSAQTKMKRWLRCEKNDEKQI